MKLAIVSGSVRLDAVQSALQQTHHEYEWLKRDPTRGTISVKGDFDLAVVIKKFRETDVECLADLCHQLPDGLPIILTEPKHFPGVLAKLTNETLRTDLMTADNCRVLAARSVNSHLLQCPPYRLDLSKGRIWVENSEAALTPREFDLAAFIFSRPNRTLDREWLMHAIWGVRDFVVTRTLDTHISRLRFKLELTGRYGWTLRSIYQRGYRLECPGPECCPKT